MGCIRGLVVSVVVRDVSRSRHPKTWYVDNSLGSNGNGTSWATAWNSFANIVWGSVAAGDTVLISGGAFGQTYNEALTIGASGSAGRPIVIRGATDNGRSGTVTIDRANAAWPCVDTNSKNNLTIECLTLQNTNDNCCYIHGSTSGTITAQNLTIHTGTGAAAGNARGADIRSNSGTVLFQNNTIDTPANFNSQTDGIYVTGNSGGGVFIQNNAITVNNVNPNQHNDCIQIVQDGACTVRSNYLSHPTGGLNNHGLLVQDPVTGGTCDIYNNIIVMGQSLGNQPEVAVFLETLTTGYTGTVNVINNTIYGGVNCIQFYEPTYHATWVVKNNILYATPITQAAYLINGATGLTIDNNLVYGQSGNLRATVISGSVGAVRSTTSKSSGLAYFEIQLGVGITSGNTLIGIANASQSLTTYIGSSTNSFGVEWDNGRIYTNGSWSVAVAASSPGNFLAFAIDFGNKKAWIKNLTTGSGWNNDVIGNQNPATNTGGFSFSAMTGPFFIAISIGGAKDYVILNVGASPFAGSLPSGYSPWGSATTLNPSDIGSPCTLTAPVALTAGGGTAQTWAGWKGLGYDTNGVNSDPLFVAAGSDFRLTSASPARTAGAVIGLVSYDLYGVARPGTAYDLGAYQYVVLPSGLTTPSGVTLPLGWNLARLDTFGTGGTVPNHARLHELYSEGMYYNASGSGSAFPFSINNQQQLYGHFEDVVVFSTDHLTIQGRGHPDNSISSGQMTSWWSDRSFVYEFRFKAPSTPGAWIEAWAYAVAQGDTSELDVELVKSVAGSENVHQVFLYNHGGTETAITISDSNFSTYYNNASFDWSSAPHYYTIYYDDTGPGTIRRYIDGVLIYQSTWKWNESLGGTGFGPDATATIDLAIGGDWPGNVTSPSTWSGDLDIYSIGLYTKRALPTGAAWDQGYKSSGMLLSADSLTVSKRANNATDEIALCNVVKSAGKWYWEIVATGSDATKLGLGIANRQVPHWGAYLGEYNSSIAYYGGGSALYNGGVVGTWASFTSGARVCFALDKDNNKLWARVGTSGNWNNVAIGSSNPATNTGGYTLPSSLQTSAVGPAVDLYNTAGPDTVVGCFSSASWAGTPPSGFGALT